MFHNAGEYAVLQIWGEAFASMQQVGMTNQEIVAVFDDWKARGTLDSYMLDVTREVRCARHAGLLHARRHARGELHGMFGVTHAREVNPIVS